MEKHISLDKVNVKVLPPKAITLLSQYAYYIKKYNGTVIKLASKTVLKDIHTASVQVDNDILNDIYQQIENEINKHLYSKQVIYTTQDNKLVKSKKDGIRQQIN